MKLFNDSQYAATNESFSYWPFEYFLAGQKHLGIRTVEIWAGPPHVIANDEWHERGESYTELARHYGLTIAACSSEQSIGRQYMFCSYDDYAHEKALKQHKQLIDFTAETGAKILTVNCAGGVMDEDRRCTLDRAVNALKMLGDYAEARGVSLAVEALPKDRGNITHTLEEMQDLIRRVDHPSVKVAMDIGTVYEADETIQSWFDAFGEKLVHIHLRTKNVPIEAVLTDIKNNGYSGAIGINLAEYNEDPIEEEEKGFALLKSYFMEDQA